MKPKYELNSKVIAKCPASFERIGLVLEVKPVIYMGRIISFEYIVNMAEHFEGRLIGNSVSLLEEDLKPFE